MPTKNAQKHLETAIADAVIQLQTSAQFGIAADQRATSLAGTLLQTATALSAALFGWSAVNTISITVIVVAAVAIGGMFIGGVICVLSASPATFYSAGNPPDFWRWQIDKKKTYPEALSSQLDEYKDKIENNTRTVSKNARMFKMGALIGSIAPLLSSLTLLAIYVWQYLANCHY